jgi:hypothetical protein
MHFRDHPLLAYYGFPSWPPVWTRARGTSINTVRGELGILKGVVARDIGQSTKCFLIIEHDGEQYVGTLLISDAAANAFFYRFLQGQIERAIKDIGDLEVGHTL